MSNQVNRPNSSNALTYRDAGVDIDAGNQLVERIKPAVKSTERPGVAGDLGGFGGLFDLAKCGYRDPILVSATDGVGTKLRLAIDAGELDGLGTDLVAMCANDLVVQGAEPLFFLDYFATGTLSVDEGARVVEGIARGCRLAGAALIGGETAEMPGLYRAGDFDLAGFCVGAVERDAVLPRSTLCTGDILLGLTSSGAHSNGYSLIRKIVEITGADLSAAAPFDPQHSLATVLLEPTRIYVKPLLNALRSTQGSVKALAHITGGGLTENLPRVLPEGIAAEIELSSWSPPPLFEWLSTSGGVAPTEMLRTFNCGIGMVMIVSQEAVDTVAEIVRTSGEDVVVIGQLINDAIGREVRYHGRLKGIGAP